MIQCILHQKSSRYLTTQFETQVVEVEGGGPCFEHAAVHTCGVTQRTVLRCATRHVLSE